MTLDKTDFFSDGSRCQSTKWVLKLPQNEDVSKDLFWILLGKFIPALLLLPEAAAFLSPDVIASVSAMLPEPMLPLYSASFPDEPS
jgi:hypothetical protein